jgi:PadR family transcriptional regulator, regulatory protein PadR
MSHRRDNYIDRHSTSIYITHIMNPKLTSDLLRGHTDTIILKLLLEGDKYGYEIAKLVHEHSHGQYELNEATMYSSLKRLENDGSITSYWGDQSQGGRRKYYAASPSGKELYLLNRRNWHLAKDILATLL